jgi:hypothetical protein
MNIKTSILLAALLCAGAARAESGWSLPVYVPAPSGATNSNANASAGSYSGGGSAQGVGSQGQSLSIDSHAVYQAQQRNPVSTAVAPALSSSNDTCMGSTSVGASAVAFSVSFGSSWTDNNCLMLKNAREMWNMGFRGAALARMCMDDLNRQALEATGIVCPVGRRGTDSAGLEDEHNTGDAYRNRIAGY